MICVSGCASGDDKAFLGGQKQGFTQGNGKGAGHTLLSAVSADANDWAFGVWERNLAS